MDYRILLRGWLITFIFAVLFAGCNKEDDLPPDFKELSFTDQEVLDRLPDGLLASNDPKAQECVIMIQEALDMSAFQDNLEVPDNAQRLSKKASGDTWSWTFSYRAKHGLFTGPIRRIVRKNTGSWRSNMVKETGMTISLPGR
ncbi:MAG: hypothetical protein KAS29_20700 [Bacteroidales bacterium]|nr:hypothetical protein [Bacteroidales bacterium]